MFPTLNNTRSSPLRLLHWNCRGAFSSLPDLIYLANSYQILCVQESLLLPTSRFHFPGFDCIRSDITSPGSRGLCLLIRRDFRYSIVDLNLAHSSVEFQAILVHCSLDSPILVINLYRHSNIKTPFLFFSNLFAAISTYKYFLVLGDFNAHHHAWGDARIDGQGDAVLRASAITSIW